MYFILSKLGHKSYLAKTQTLNTLFFLNDLVNRSLLDLSLTKIFSHFYPFLSPINIFIAGFLPKLSKVILFYFFSQRNPYSLFYLLLFFVVSSLSYTIL